MFMAYVLTSAVAGPAASAENSAVFSAVFSAVACPLNSTGVRAR
jgi:hypothetical protein